MDNGDPTLPWKITSNARASQAPAKLLVYEGINELAQDGYLSGRGLPFPVQPGDIAIYATSQDGDQVGVLCYSRVESEITITLLYVEPSSRKQGLARALLNSMVYRETGPGDALAKMYVDPDNEVGAEVAQKCGFVKSYAGWALAIKAE